MKKFLKYSWLSLKWLLVGLAGLLVLVLILFYLPPVQDFAVKTALNAVNSKGDMQIEVKRARILFPMRLRVDSVDMQNPGMEIASSRIRGDISLLPLLAGEVKVNGLLLADAKVNIGTPDSTMYMRATLQRASLSDATIHLFTGNVDVSELAGRNGHILLDIKPDSVPKPEKKSEPIDWAVNLDKVKLEGVYYRMSMLPTIVDLQCALPSATLTDGKINLKRSTINVQNFSINRVDALYVAGKAVAEPTTPVDTLATDTVASAPWLINATEVRLNNSHAIYAAHGATPTAGFNPEYIEVSDVNIAIDSLMNLGAAIRVPLRNLSATERCGLALKASGLFEMDSVAMRAQGFEITTPLSTISLDALMGLEVTNPPVSAKLSASLANEDIRRLLPASAAQIAKMLPPYAPVNIAVDINGHMENIEVHQISAEIPRYVSLNASGYIADYSDINSTKGNLKLEGNLINGDFVKPTLFDAKMRRQVNLPPLSLRGNIAINSGIIDGNLEAATKGGDIALDAWWNNRATAYDVGLDFNHFPIQSILPLSGLRNIDATIDAKGHGFDFFSSKTAVDASVVLNHAEINKRTFSDIVLKASLADGHADIDATSANRKADFNIIADGNIAGQTMNWNFSGNVKNIDLEALGLSDTTAEGSVQLAGTASFTPAVAATRRTAGKPMQLSADVDVQHLYWHMPGDAINADSLKLNFVTSDSVTHALLTNHDLRISLTSPQPLDTITKHLGWTSLALDRDMKRRRLAIDTLQRAMPKFNLALSAGPNNVITNYLAGRDMSFKSLKLEASNDSVFNMSAKVLNFKSGETLLDTLALSMVQQGAYLLYNAEMNNRPGTMDNFAHVNLGGYINADRLSATISQQDVDDRTGYSLGLIASLADQTKLRVHFVPYHPVIGFKEWEINRDNFVAIDLADNHIDANLDLHNNVSSVRLFTDHNHADSTQSDINLQVKDLKLSDWMAINPFAPPVTGTVSADMKVNWHKPDLNGSGTLTLQDFNYGKQKVGDFNLDFNLATNAAGTVRATTSLMVNGRKAITASGNLNDSTSPNPFMLDFRMIQFPLDVVNPFLPEGIAKMAGTLNGNLDITGEMTAPLLNGDIYFDSTTVNVTMLGTPLRFSETHIPVENSIVKFNNFAILGVNDKSLTINGTVDLTSLSAPALKLNMRAREMQIVGSEKKRGTQAFGKAFIDLDADVSGNLHMLNVEADLNLLPSTNVTYVMADAAQTLQSRSNQNMVKFVNFADTTAVEAADSVAPPSMMMNIDARLTISTGTTITVELDPSGNSRVQLISNGTVNYTRDYMADQRVSGRINLTGGFVRYAVPLIGEKSFTFREGSYVEFNGNMMNPILHIDAYDDIRANVSGDSGNSRVVNFNVLLKVDGTLDEMNVVFDLECPDDLTIANEIKSMSPEQRANQAMNLLLYGSYKSGGTQTITSGSMGSNALYSFLQSQLNSWAASAIKGVDISFGINQYDKTVDGANTTAMNYSYQVSKSLFDDRFKIVVGGNYTTDADADENFAQNLIADISFEYMLNKAGTMYVRLFRHTGYESILEGEITQTGVGFVYKKKISRLADIFKRSSATQIRVPQGSVSASQNEVPAPPNEETPIEQNSKSESTVIKPDDSASKSKLSDQ